jgi:hypothetical protein
MSKKITRNKKNKMGTMHFKKPSKKSVMPYWAFETIDKEEIASILLQAIYDQNGQCGDVLEVYFGNDEKVITEILTENQFEPEFIYSHLNNDFGKGVILGLLMFFLKEKMADKEVEDEGDSSSYYGDDDE